MPTPVTTARQCLTEEAGRALDDAVAVARRRCHAQTTSLHALSALLTLPSSLLRDACSRSPSSAYSPRLLDLCVSVSLDRQPTAKSTGDDPPPISNSLMAAIKRSQANQRRQPEMYQILHHAANPISSISLIKVELKNFVISILDDPIVSRVLAEAGFHSTDIKLAIIRPPAPPFPFPTRFLGGGAGGRCPPLFLCNLADSGFPVGRNIPFSLPGVGDSDGDEYSRRIGEIMICSRRRNPLLVGVCSRDSLQRFKDCVNKENGKGVLPSTIVGLNLICVEKEITKFVFGGGSKGVLDSMAMGLSSTLENHSGPGVVVNFGDLNVLVKDGGSEDAVKGLVSKLSSLVELFKKKMWLIGVAASYETYGKFLTRFPTIEKDWDLQLLPITSSSSSAGNLYSKSSLMGSFVPFGGFFSTPPEFKSQPFTRCGACNEKYDQELSALMRKGSPVSVADRCSSTLPSWLQMAGNATGEAKDDKEDSNAKAMELRRKWDSICQRLHHVPKIPSESSMAVTSVPCSLSSQLHSDDRLSSTLSCSFPSIAQTNTSHGQNLKPKQILHSQPQIASENPKTLSHVSTRSSRNLNLAPEQKSPSSVSSVVTDLGLGTFRHAKGPLDQGDYKLILKKLTEKLPWQAEACHHVGQIVSHYKARNHERGTWVCFSGPDMVGKKRMAEALADLVFGGRDSLIAVDLSAQERMSKPHLMFDAELPNDPGVKSGRKTIIDYIAEELSKKPFSVVMLENVDRVDDLLVQRSLSRAIETGKLPDLRGREINISNAIILMTCSSSANVVAKFLEERILEARNWQMQIVIKPVDGETAAKSSNRSYVAFRSKKQKGFIDLNLPLDEEDSRAWLEDLLEQVEKIVTFKPFDFDSLSEKLLDKMSLTLENKLGMGTRLEVDEEVMVQILGAAWCSDKEGAIFHWIEEVLGGSFVEARTKLGLDRESLLQLASLAGVPAKEDALGVRLPRVVSLE